MDERKFPTSPTLIPLDPSPRKILARYPSSMHSISTVALSYDLLNKYQNTIPGLHEHEQSGEK